MAAPGGFSGIGKPYSEIAIFRSIVRPGDTVLDLGANRAITCPFLRFGRPDWHRSRIRADSADICHVAKECAAHSGECSVFLNNLAAGDSEGIIKMFVADGRFTEASMVSHSPQSQTANYDCRVTTIDRYINEKNIGKVDIIKCDLEGAELLAMKGTTGLLKSKNPPILFLEAWSGWTKDFGYQPADLFGFLEREAGYAIYHVCRDGIKRISAEEPLPPDSFPDFLNFLCVVPPVHGNRIRLLKQSGIDIIE